MKVFTYDTATGSKGEQIADIQPPCGLRNLKLAKCRLPSSRSDTQWAVATAAEDKSNNLIEFDQAVCFCLGQFTAGTDTHWQWYVLLPQD